ncbi:DUF1844 domain-containing protein [Deltaproteobacteria bacterium Smac51]|nr:DUF1844 domain-containing protein [Deltaproteobacteria bacterium Smac51]
MSEEFVVNDKRLFNKDGQINEDAETAKEAPADSASEPSFPRNEPGGETFKAGGSLPPANFASLLVGLATSAFIHLGEGPEASGNPPDLEGAKHAIDLLVVLQTKTEGNLEQEEDELLTALLYDLRMKYVQACQKNR